MSLRTHRVLLVAFMLSACEISEVIEPEAPEPTVPTIVSASLTRSTVTVNEGEFTTLGVDFLDASGNPVVVDPSDPLIQWSTSNNTVATVTATPKTLALITGRSRGTTTVTVRRDNVQASATVSVTSANGVTASVVNYLLAPVLLTVNGRVEGRVEPGDSTLLEWESLASFQLEWDIERPQTSEGDPVGPELGGRFAEVTSPRGHYAYTIDNVVGSTTFFAPVLRNESGSGLLMGVNMGLSSEHRCRCVVVAGATQAFLGYYQLYSNSNVRGYRSDSDYTGPYIYWDEFTESVTPLSGRLGLRATSAPSPPRAAGSLGPAPTSPRPPSPGTSDDVLRR